MKEVNENLKNSMMEIGQNIYSQQGAENKPNSDQDDVIETDFSTDK